MYDDNYLPGVDPIICTLRSVFLFISGLLLIFCSISSYFSEEEENNEKRYEWIKRLLIIKFIIFIIFGISFGFLIVFSSIANDEKYDPTCKTGYLKDVNDTFLKLKDIWCRSKPIQTEKGIVDIGCGCYIEDYSQWNEEDQAKLKDKTEYSNIQSSALFGVRTVQTCEYYSKLTMYHQQQVVQLKVMEKLLECVGVCDTDIIYYIHDLTKNVPKSKEG